jgi:hypothetical protein
MVNVVVSRKRTVQISANATAGIIDTTTPVVLKNNPVVVSGGVTRLDKLTDVSANNEINGATLVYNAANDTYVVQKLDLSNVTGDLDGGTF